ncbi:His/Glu/Gln/Arg/opine family amino acid ABC transporter permease subunit [Rhizobium leguminosarum]|uniref:His/Glu/Gln/Arg/opine family amino acid ABC transporter permease subunit n=1 Tax=Rhizobium leguminosarum TaxID=384 RepID=A0AAE2MIS4_RHILE|nr:MULTISPECIES: ABC transporter permease subunit [Rhizobium]MBB4290343.1 His/Glu/Gln/Arg/opine family amino acid ABC transporter permease subunit [Rhizobium leguminosarum]MBB4296986.1 His/Glu/Gln/Arg/opine family amino acid ABC transporter permease subunit [Rhizobium leguminosarum]MBB4307752.1 His/Glu/Gln/Arg/opine family amino acid ABC transporter permease subunit [Rhizobium leguminosarum]MBB4415588.1 His/Glu/Gln/Arg/opine family amino acid ABC transporter permease subunit [Rhizobium legumino
MTIHEASAVHGMVDHDHLKSRRLRNRIRHEAIQFGIIAIVVALLGLLAYAIQSGLAEKGIRFSFSFLANTAGFDISEGWTLTSGEGFLPSFTLFSPDMTVASAFVTGIFNTAKVAVLAIILSTILGTMLGVGRLSTNWVVRNLCFWIVEFVRNTPLLIQLVFWYFAVVLRFPPMASAAHFYGLIVSQQGIYVPALSWAGGDSMLPIVLATLTCVAILGAIFDPIRGMRRACIAAAVVGIVLLFATGGVSMNLPVANKFKASGGTSISPEMAALLVAIVVNSASFIAETVRGAIDALPKSQWEAAASLSLSRRYTVNDIVLPQVFRVVLPSFGNQYISLTKNTALGIAVGYPDLFNIYGTIANQKGHSLEGIIIVMASYLILSWVISTIVYWANRRLNPTGVPQ